MNYLTKISMTGLFLFSSVAVQAADSIVVGSQCVGFDCTAGESFGFDTGRYKENNLRIHFDDSTSTGSFPRNDWRIIINDSSNGGANYFAVEDSTAGRVPFKIEAGAIANALYVDAGGDVGIGTANPVVELHAVDGNTPTIRLEQDGSSGFTPQTWDMAGNETNFFIRDVTNGSKLPFRIRPDAPDASIMIAANGNIGFGVQSPSEALDITRSNAAARLKLTSITSTNNEGAQMIWRRARSGSSALELNDNLGAFSFRGHDGTSWTGSRGFINVVASENWAAGAHGTEMIFQTTQNGTAAVSEVMRITNDGKVRINGIQLNVPDYVFEEDYELMTLDQLSNYIEENKHLPGVASADDVNSNGLDLAGSQLSVLEKVEELTLYTLQQHKKLKQMEVLKAENLQLKAAHRQLLTSFHAQQESQQKAMAALSRQLATQQQLVDQLIQSQEGTQVYTSLK